MNLVAVRRSDLNGRKNEFQFLHQHTLHLEKFVLLFRIELLAAGKVHEFIELLPALEVILQTRNELLELVFCVHRHFGFQTLRLAVNKSFGLRWMSAPPLNSWAVSWRLAKWRRTSESGSRAFRASPKRFSTRVPISRSTSGETLEETVVATT